MALLELRNVCLGYGPIRAVDNASLHIDEHEVVAIIGGNGAGKSTMLKGISGLLGLGSGQILFAGADISQMPPHRRVAAGIALSPEGRQVFSDQSVHDNLVLGAYARGLDKATLDAEIEAQFDLFPRLRERRNQMSMTLSGGEQQMLAIARALMAKPRLLLLDEPSLGLAPIIVRDMFRIIRSLKDKGIAILIVEQMATMALKVAHRAYVLETGRITLSGTGEQLLHDPKVRAAYLGVAHGQA